MSLIQRQPNCLMLEENCSCNMLILVKISSPAKLAHLLSSVLVPVRPERSLEVDLTCNVFHPPTTFSSVQIHQGLIVLRVRGRLSIWPSAKMSVSLDALTGQGSVCPCWRDVSVSGSRKLRRMWRLLGRRRVSGNHLLLSRRGGTRTDIFHI